MTNINEKPTDMSKRAAITGAAAVTILNFLPSIPAFAETPDATTPTIEQQIKDTQELTKKRDDADQVRDELEAKKRQARASRQIATITDEEWKKLYDYTFYYGQILRVFEDKYGQGQDMFQQDESDDMKAELLTWLNDNKDASNTQARMEFEKYLDNAVNFMVAAGYDAEITRKFLEAMWCGYNGKLCAPTS